MLKDPFNPVGSELSFKKGNWISLFLYRRQDVKPFVLLFELILNPYELTVLQMDWDQLTMEIKLLFINIYMGCKFYHILI